MIVGERAVHRRITTIGVDLAKNVFQVHCVDAGGKVIIARQLRRGRVNPQAGAVSDRHGACATAHHWARELTRLGHTLRANAGQLVEAYVRSKRAADAAAICEAITRPSMRFVPIKLIEQQAALMLHRARDLLVRQRTQLINALRVHLCEISLVAATGVVFAKHRLNWCNSDYGNRLPLQVFSNTPIDAFKALAACPPIAQGNIANSQTSRTLNTCITAPGSVFDCR